MSATTTGGDDSSGAEQCNRAWTWNRGTREAEIERVNANKVYCCSGAGWLDGETGDRQSGIGQPEASECGFIVEVFENRSSVGELQPDLAWHKSAVGIEELEATTDATQAAEVSADWTGEVKNNRGASRSGINAVAGTHHRAAA